MIPGDLILAGQIIPALRATNRWEAIPELVDNLVQQGRIKPQAREAVIAAVETREALMTTGLGLGIALPHARTGLIDRPMVALGRSLKGVAFEAIDYQPVTLVLLFLVPPWFDATNPQHFQITATLVRMLQDKTVRQALAQAPDAKAMHDIICRSEARR